MPIQVQQFPILTPGQMNPFNQALASGLNTYQNMTKAAYLPAQTEANIGAKTAYAKNLGKQMIATILGNPMAVASMDDNQFQSLVKQVTAPDSQATNATSPERSGLWNNLMEQLGLRTSPTPQTQAQIPMQTQAAQPTTTGEFGEVNRAPDSMVEDIAQHGNLAYQQGDKNIPTQTQTQTTPSYTDKQQIKDAYVAKNFPGTDKGIAAAKRLEEAKKGGAASATSYQEYKDNVYTISNSAQSALNDLNDFHASYNKAVMKGPLTKAPVIKQLAQLDPNYQTAINDANNLVVNLAPLLLAGGKQTDAGRALVRDAKIEPSLAPSAEKHVFEKQSLILNRMAENDLFSSEMEEYGIIDINRQRSAWLDYNRKYPLVDKEGNLMNKNLDKYKEYISKNYGNGITSSGNQNNNKSSSGGYDPVKMLDYKYKSASEFKAAFDSLNDESKKIVRAEMERRGWK